MKKHKVQSKREAKVKKKRTNRWPQIISLSIMMIMIVSVVGFMWTQNIAETANYENFAFKKQGQKWLVNVNGEDLNFQYLPDQVKQIPVDGKVQDLLNQRVLQLTYDPRQEFVQEIAQAAYYTGRNLNEVKKTVIINGLKEANDYNIPVITCDNATEFQPVIDFILSNESKVIVENNCIKLYARSGNDFTRVKDRLIYEAYGVLNGRT